MKIAHHNDGKEKCQSHKAYFLEDKEFYMLDDTTYVSGHNLSDLVGYGETFEEAKNNLIKQLDWLINEIDALRNLIDVTAIVDVDCFGKEISHNI